MCEIITLLFYFKLFLRICEIYKMKLFKDINTNTMK